MGFFDWYFGKFRIYGVFLLIILVILLSFVKSQNFYYIESSPVSFGSMEKIDRVDDSIPYITKQYYHPQTPKIILSKIGEEYINDKWGRHYDQINLLNLDNHSWFCKIRLCVSANSEVSHPNFHYSESKGNMDIYDTEMEEIVVSGIISGYTNLDIMPSSPNRYVSIDIFPVCLIDGIETEMIRCD